MTIEQAQARIAMLEDKVRKLETGSRNHWKSAIPVDWIKERKSVFPYASPTSYAGLCTLIRATVFAETEYKSGRMTKNGRVSPTRYINCTQMSDDQYDLYIRTMKSALQAIIDAREEAVEKGLNGFCQEK